MNARAALDLLRPAIPSSGGLWADFGAGSGAFTRALAELLGPAGRVIAVDRDARALARLAAQPQPANAAPIVTLVADFTLPLVLPQAERRTLDGLLLANALHFVSDAAHVLTELCDWLSPAGRVVLIEYDRRAASPWVPYPLDVERLPELAHAAGLTVPKVLARLPSAYAGEIYTAAADRRIK